MSIDDSSIMMEVSSIQEAVENPKLFLWKATIHAGTNDIEVSKVKSYVRLKDFANNQTDKINVVVMIGIGDYNHLIRTNRGTLELTLRRYEATEREAVEVIGQPISVERFRAVPPEEKHSSMNDSMSVDVKREDANKTAMLDLSLELLSPTIEQLRAVQVGGLYTAKNSGELVRTLLTKFSKGIGVDKERDIKGVDIISGYNETPRENYDIAHGTTLLDLPGYIHRKCGGVYSAGMGWYLQDYLWFVYPLYDVQRFDNELDTLTIIMVPENKIPRLKNTYRKTNNHLVILVTAAPTVIDDTESLQYNMGNGVRFVDATKVMGGLGKANDNKYTVSKQDNVYEVLSNQRAEGNNMAPVSATRISDNPFFEYSKMARANTVHIQFEWMTSDDKLLYPGMPVRIVRWANDEVREEFGTLLGAETFHQLADNVLSDQYIQQSILTVGVKKTY